ncbi:alpha/beta fold hydrolase [Streptomyces sp. NPDC002306]
MQNLGAAAFGVGAGSVLGISPAAARTVDVSTADGRILRVTESGALSGRPVILLHGSPSSSLEVDYYSAIAAREGVRLLSYDRPGFGGSDPNPGRRVADCAGDIRSVAVSRGLSRFAILGISSGGPHALAAAALLPEVVKVATSGTIGPVWAAGLDFYQDMGASTTQEIQLALAGRDALHGAFGPYAEAISADPTILLADMSTGLPAVDQRALESLTIRTNILASVADGVRNGDAGWVDDDIALVTPWGFDISSIRRPVRLFHGAVDNVCPPGHSRWLAGKIPTSQLNIIYGGGHLLYMVDPTPMLRWLVS